MKKASMITIMAVVTMMTICGCSQYWYQEAKTFDECNQGRQDCFNELKKRTDFKNLTMEYEVEFMNECMANKGYEAVSQDQLPLDVKREEPPSSFHWRAKGIAGQLSK